MSLQDTRLKQPNNKLASLFPHHTIYHSCQENGTSIAVLIHKSIRHRFIQSIIRDRHNSLTVCIQDRNIFQHDIFITSLYVPPTSNKHRGVKMDPQLLHDALNYKYAILLGDLNAHHKDLGCKTNNTRGVTLKKFINEHDHIILNDTTQSTFTHTAVNFSDTLDYVITTPAIALHLTQPSTDEDIGSDHTPLVFLFRRGNRSKHAIRLQHNLNTNKTDWDLFSASLNDSITNDISLWPPRAINSESDLNDQAESLITHFQAAIKNSTPTHRPANPTNPRLPPEIILMIKTRRCLKRKQAIHPQDHIRKQINLLNKQIKQEIKNTKKSIQNNRARVIQQGPRHPQFWRTVKSLIHSQRPHRPNLKHNGRILIHPNDQTQAFFEYYKDIFTDTQNVAFDYRFAQYVEHNLPDLSPVFPPLPSDNHHPLTEEISQEELQCTLRKVSKNKAPGPDTIRYEHLQKAPNNAITIILHIYNRIMLTAFIPTPFKKTCITVIPKANKDLTQLSSYRPITLAPTLSKVFEHIINSRLLRFVLHHKLIKEHQTAFLPGKDSCQNILHALQTITDNFNVGYYTLALSLDMKQAFDRTWHNGILHILQPHVPVHFLRLIYAFLSRRSISVKYDAITSTQTFIPTQGVPQGSPLSPLLFNLLMSTAPAVNTKVIQTHNYADDTFYISSADTPTKTWTQLQPHLNKFLTWCNQYRLTIQPYKTTNTFFTRKTDTSKDIYPPITIQNTTIPRQTTISILGVTLDTRLTLKKHIKRVTETSLNTINTIRKTMQAHPYISPRIPILLYTALLRSKYIYAAPLLTLIKPTTWRTLQSIEHRAIRAAYRRGIRTRISKLYELSKLTPIKQYYQDMSKKALQRAISQKNKRLLSTVMSANHCKHLKYTTPPLDNALNLHAPEQQEHIIKQIHLLFFPPIP